MFSPITTTTFFRGRNAHTLLKQERIRSPSIPAIAVFAPKSAATPISARSATLRHQRFARGALVWNSKTSRLDESGETIFLCNVMKRAIREAEAGPERTFGLTRTGEVSNLPFYQTGTSEEDPIGPDVSGSSRLL